MKKIFLLFTFLLLSVFCFSQGTMSGNYTWNGNMMFKGKTWFSNDSVRITAGGDTATIGIRDGYLYITCYACDSIHFYPSVLSGAVPTSRTIATTAPLSGGGNLTTNRTITTSMSTNKLIGRGTAGTGVMEEITLGTNLSLSGTTINVAKDTSAIEFIIDGGGSVPSTGIKGDIEVPFNCTIVRVSMFADQAGSAVVQVWSDKYSNFPPTVADAIYSATPPTITTADKSQDATLSSWVTAIPSGNILRFNLSSVATITRLTISIKVIR